jgi:hypothetical protein
VWLGLFVPKPSCGMVYRRRSTRGLRQTVRACLLVSTAVGGDCHSLRHSVAGELVVTDSCTHTPFESVDVRSRQVTVVYHLELRSGLVLH